MSVGVSLPRVMCVPLEVMMSVGVSLPCVMCVQDSSVAGGDDECGGVTAACGVCPVYVRPALLLHLWQNLHTDQGDFSGLFRWITHRVAMYQGWDSSSFTRIFVEQKLKSLVDDDHFRGKKIEEKKREKIRNNPSLYLACPHSVVSSSYCRMCSLVALLFWFSKMATRVQKVLMKQE